MMATIVVMGLAEVHNHTVKQVEDEEVAKEGLLTVSDKQCGNIKELI